MPRQIPRCAAIRATVMKKSTAIIVSLGMALITSNAWWAYRLMDSRVTLAYQQDSLRLNQEALSQAIAVIKAVSRPGVTREEVIAAAQGAAESSETFQKDGYLWVGSIGLRFAENGRLVEATPSWSPFP